MNKLFFQRLFPPLLLVGMLLTVAFVQRFEEPYPAIYQPAFQYATTDTDRVRTQVAEIVAYTTDGKAIALNYEDLFRFAPDNRDVFLFRMIPDSVPTYLLQEAADKNWRKQLIGIIITDYQDAVEEKKANEYQAWLTSLEDLAEAHTGEDLAGLELKLYDVTYQLSSGETEQQPRATKKILFSPL